MLRLGPLSEDLTATAPETIERSAKMQASLIDDILDISKGRDWKAVAGEDAGRPAESDGEGEGATFTVALPLA